MSTAVTHLDIAPAAPAADGFGALRTGKGNLPLEQLDVRIAVSGLTVHTELTQGFRNPYDEPLEATYVFGLPDRAAVTSLRMTADDRTVDGVLREREQARAEYDKAIGEGKRASIAEEERPGVFTMRVGNILPGERVSVRLTLAGRLVWEDGEVTVRFPLVIAPRYIPGLPLEDDAVGSGTAPDTDAVPDASRITPPVLLPGFPNPVELSIEADIDPAGLPMAEVASSLHPIDVEEGESGQLRVRVHPGERADRDFILRLRLGDNEAVSSSLVTVPDTESAGGTFAMTLVPPAALAPAKPRDVVFVLDRSGSMRGPKMVAARRAAARIVDTLGSRDRFAVLAFDNRVETPPELPDGMVAATDRNRFRAVEYLAGLSARGGTEMLRPLGTAADLLAGNGEDGGRERALVLITDGQVGNEDQILRELAGKLPASRVHTVGVDVAVNEAFLRRLATLGGGRYELVESEDRLDEALAAIHSRIGTPLVTDLTLTGDGLDIEPDTLTPAPLPALYAGSALVITGRYRSAAAGGAVTVAGVAAGGAAWSERLTHVPSGNPALPACWARARLRDLEDSYVTASVPRSGTRRGPSRQDLERDIVALSLRFSVLCRFTAYVAVDSRVVNEGGTVRRVTQPVELPQGWEPPGEPVVPVTARAPMRAAMEAGGTAPMAAAPRPRAARPQVQSILPIRDTRASLPELKMPQRLVDDARSHVRRLREATVSERFGLLADVRDWLASLDERTADPLVLRPLQHLLRDLQDFTAVRRAGVAETERMWLRTVDVLTAIVDLAGSGPTPTTTPPRAGRPRRRAFWKR